jgi:CHAD domain-containing protein
LVVHLDVATCSRISATVSIRLKAMMASDKREPSRHTEVERKFTPAETSVSPSFEGLSSVGRIERSPVQNLDAVYFDTPEYDLAAHGVTLRRRTGGPDAGWHLKLPAGPDARTEVRLPLGDAAGGVPEQLRDVVLAIVRHKPLAPVARIETARTVDVLYGPSGEPLAEFCDDQVTASAGPDDARQGWREWELELVEDGDPDSGKLLLDRLANRLLDAGAEPAGHGSKLARVLDGARGDSQAKAAESTDPVHRAIAQHREELLVWDRAVRADAWDSVHQMRVVTRKIRSLLRASEESFGITDDAWVLEELRLLAGILGSARDAEVLAERYERALDELPPDLVRGPIRERLVEGAKRRYQAGWRRSLTAMRSERYFRLLDALDALVASEPTASEDGTERAPATIEYPYKRVRKAMKKARAAEADAEVSAAHRDETLHKVRKRAKQLRYTAAALGEPEVADRAKAVQALLGDHQDSVVSRVHLSQEAIAARGANEDTFTYGVLFQQEAELALRSEEQLDGALKRLKKAVRKSD